MTQREHHIIMIEFDDQLAALMLMPIKLTNAIVPARILVVDEEEDIRTVLRAFLKAWGYEVIVADSGAAALEWAKKSAGKLDLLITNFRMPSMDGIELAQRMRNRHSELKVLYMSGDLQELAKNRKFEIAANLIAKPFQSGDLAVKVSYILDR